MPSTGADRLSTWEEVRQATSANPEGMLEFRGRMALPCEVRSENGGPEAMDESELEFLLHLHGMDDQPLN